MGTSLGVTGGQLNTESGNDQAGRRRYRKFTDVRDGRRWGANVEGPDGGPLGPWEYQKPKRGAPMPGVPITNPRYLEVVSKQNRAYHGLDPDDHPNKCIVRYDVWKAAIRRAWQDRVKLVQDEYDKLSIPCDWTPTNGVGMRSDVRAKVGPDPDAIEPVLACEQGNRWALYGEGECPPKLRKFIKVRTRTDTGILGDREDFTVDGDDEPAPLLEAEREAAPASLAEDVDALAQLDDEHERKGQAGGTVPIPSRKPIVNKGGRPKGSKNNKAAVRAAALAAVGSADTDEE